MDLFKKYWPLQREIPDHPVIPLFVKTGPNELIAVDERLRGDWYETFEKCQKNHIYNEESFRWRKSLIRTAFLESISVCVPFLKIGINEDLIIGTLIYL